MPTPKRKKKERKRNKYVGNQYTCPREGVFESSSNNQQQVSIDNTFTPTEIPCNVFKHDDDDVTFEYSVPISKLDNILRQKDVIMGDSTPPIFVINITKEIDAHYSTWRRSYIEFCAEWLTHCHC